MSVMGMTRITLYKSTEHSREPGDGGGGQGERERDAQVQFYTHTWRQQNSENSYHPNLYCLHVDCFL